MLVAVGCVMASVLLLTTPGRATGRLHDLSAVPPGPRVPKGRIFVESAVPRTCLVAVALGVVGWVVLGPGGAVVGLVAGLGVSRWIGRLEPPAVARAREEIVRDLPLAVDLLAACSIAGRSPQQSLPVVSRAMGGALGARLDEIAARLSLGADPAAEWARVAVDPELAELGRAMQRAFESGAPLAEGLSRLAEDRRRDRRTRTQMRARSVGVRAAGPLAACFLPAFMLVGVVPTIAGSFQHLFG